MESTIPHAVYIAEHFLKQPALYVGTPLIIGSYAKASWNSYASIFFLEYLPSLYDLLEKNGARRRVMSKHRKKNLKYCYDYLFELWSNKDANYRSNFKLLKFIQRNYKFSEFWMIVGKILLGVTRRIKRSALKSVLKSAH
jgi:hypothetical protein